MKRAVDGQLSGLVALDSYRTDVRAVSAAEVDEKDTLQMLVVEKGGVHARARGMVNAKVRQIRVAAK